ncbi:MAG: hypothetical protein WDM84_00425 [Bauldia sp.]
MTVTTDISPRRHEALWRSHSQVTGPSTAAMANTRNGGPRETALKIEERDRHDDSR